MQRRFLGEILAMLLVGGSALLLIQLDSHGILSCVPLLVGLYAIHRGATWAAFAVLAGATGLLTLTIAGQAPWLLSIAAGSAVIPSLIVLPSLWRFDRMATQILTGLALALGMACALVSYSGQQQPSSAEDAWVAPPVATTENTVVVAPPSRVVPMHFEIPGSCVAADLVGIYGAGHAKGSLRLRADGRFVHDPGDGAPRRGTFAIDEHEVVLITIDGHTKRIGCHLERDGRFTLDGHTVWEVAR